LDIEMSFVQDEDVMTALEPLVAALALEFSGETIALPLLRLDYQEAVERYGNDRPDLRYGLELRDVADIAERTEFQVFRQARERGHRIRGICATGGGPRYSRKDLDGLTEYAATFGAKGLVWLKVESDSLTGPTAKFFPADVQSLLRERFASQPGD